MKTDNHNPAAKLELRRHFLRAYHAAAPPSVLDCCQATGKLWRILRAEFPVAEYFPLDITPKKGRLKLDSVRVLDQPGWKHEVVDVDTYGSPWAHWFALLRHCDHDVTVFLTVGLHTIGGISSPPDADTVRALGLETIRQRMKARGEKVPTSLFGLARDQLGLAACLAAAHDRFEIAECVEAENPGGNARYLGARLLVRPAA